jgi:hypothetical protein
MTTKFPTDHEPEHLAAMAEHAAKVRAIVEEHKTGAGVLEPSIYKPDADGKCYCIYCDEKSDVVGRVPPRKPINAPPRQGAYGCYVGRCHCGWWTIAKSGPPGSCEACRTPLSYDPNKGWGDRPKNDWVEWTEEVAAIVCSFSEVKSDFLRKIGLEQGYWLHQLSKNRWLLFHVHNGCAPGTITYKDKEVRAYMVPEVIAQGDLQEVGKVLRDKVKESLPNFLRDRR